jgi:hypothetical protein
MLDAGHDRAAVIFIRLLYVFWFVEDSTLALSVVWAGSRLVQLLTRHLFQFRVTGERYSSIKGGILKVYLFKSHTAANLIFPLFLTNFLFL